MRTLLSLRRRIYGKDFVPIARSGSNLSWAKAWGRATQQFTSEEIEAGQTYLLGNGR
jgi:hypothetical protein